MDKIAILIPIKDMFYQARYCIDNFVAKTKMNISLYILDAGVEDAKKVEYIKGLVGDFDIYNFPCDGNIEKGMNVMLSTVTEKYCCIFPMNLLVNENWLEELYYGYKNCEEAGIISIRNGNEKIFLMPFLHKNLQGEDHLSNVCFTENNSVSGLMFFNMEHLKKTGPLLESHITPPYRYDEFCFRFSLNGLRNYYIPTQTLFKIETKNETLFPSKTIEGAYDLKQHIEKSVKDKFIHA